MNKVVLDASALLALIQREQGSEKLVFLLDQAIMSAINIAETLTVLQRSDIVPAEALELMTLTIAEIVPFDIEQAQIVAELQPYVKNKGLSLGDRACIALGIKLQAPIYTADKVWSELGLEKANIIIIR